MGTYTTNYNLFMPTVGERGWGELVNGNFTTIDTTMKGLNTRLTAVESEVNGALSCTSVTTSGTITSAGVIAANGGVNGGTITGATITATTKFVGTLYGKVYVNAKTSTTRYNNDIQYATCAAQSLNVSTPQAVDQSTNSGTITINKYSKISMSYPYQLYPGVYIPSSGYFTDSVPNLSTRTATFTLTKTRGTTAWAGAYLYVNGVNVTSITGRLESGDHSTTYNIPVGASVYINVQNDNNYNSVAKASLSIPAQSTYYINVV